MVIKSSSTLQMNVRRERIKQLTISCRSRAWRTARIKRKTLIPRNIRTVRMRLLFWYGSLQASATNDMTSSAICKPHSTKSMMFHAKPGMVKKRQRKT